MSTTPPADTIIALAGRVESARTRIDKLLTTTADEPPADQVLEILRSADLIGTEETELTGALWVILTALREHLDQLHELRSIVAADGPVEQVRLLRAAEKAALTNVDQAQTFIALADRWGDLQTVQGSGAEDSPQ